MQCFDMMMGWFSDLVMIFYVAVKLQVCVIYYAETSGLVLYVCGF